MRHGRRDRRVMMEEAFDWLDAPVRGSPARTCRCPTPPTSSGWRCRRSRTSSPPPRTSATGAEAGACRCRPILMPALSPTMTEGNLAKWLKKEGDAVKAGDVIAEIETDKATMEVEAVDEGTLGKILVPDGTEGVKVNEPIALLLEEGEDASALERGGRRAPPPQPARGAPGAAGRRGRRRRADCRRRPRRSRAPPGARRRGQAGAAMRGERVFASPLARRMAQQAGLDLPASRAAGRTAASSRPTSRRRWRARGGAAGRGAGRRSAAAAARRGTAPRRPRTRRSRPPRRIREMPLNNMRKVIARRLTEVEADDPALLPDGRHRARRAAGAARRDQRPQGCRTTSSRSTTSSSRPRRWRCAGAGRQCRPGAATRSTSQGRRRLGGGGDRRRPDHADHPQGRPEGPRHDLERDEGPRQRAPRTAS